MIDRRRIPPRAAFEFWRSIAVRWGDMDALGHVNNALYLQYLESARVGFFELLGWGMEAFATLRQGPVVVSQIFHYRRQVVYPATLEVGVRCSGIRERSFDLEYAVFQAGSETLVGNGGTVMAWADLAAGRAMAVPDEMRRKLGAPLGEAPQANGAGRPSSVS